jgi:hypothetical protein
MSVVVMQHLVERDEEALLTRLQSFLVSPNDRIRGVAYKAILALVECHLLPIDFLLNFHAMFNADISLAEQCERIKPLLLEAEYHWFELRIVSEPGSSFARRAALINFFIDTTPKDSRTLQALWTRVDDVVRYRSSAFPDRPVVGACLNLLALARFLSRHTSTQAYHLQPDRQAKLLEYINSTVLLVNNSNDGENIHQAFMSALPVMIREISKTQTFIDIREGIAERLFKGLASSIARVEWADAHTALQIWAELVGIDGVHAFTKRLFSRNYDDVQAQLITDLSAARNGRKELIVASLLDSTFRATPDPRFTDLRITVELIQLAATAKDSNAVSILNRLLERITAADHGRFFESLDDDQAFVSAAREALATLKALGTISLGVFDARLVFD